MAEKKGRIPRNTGSSLPRLRTDEALASLIIVVLADRETIGISAEARDTHLQNVIEWAHDQHALTKEDVVPF